MTAGLGGGVRFEIGARGLGRAALNFVGGQRLSEGEQVNVTGGWSAE